MKPFFQPIQTLLVAATTVISACSTGDQNNKLSDQEKKDGWTLLFDGKSLAGWHLYNKGDVPSVWQVKDGTLFCNRENKLMDGDLISDSEYDNYELKFDFKIPRLGNSGVFINVQEKPSLEFAWASGPEYQLLANTHPDFVHPEKRSGCLFGFGPQLNAVALHPDEEWNHSVIKQVNGKVEFYLNGIETAKVDLNSAEWKAMIAHSNFKNSTDFGAHTKGRIGLQEWSKTIYFRNIKLKRL